MIDWSFAEAKELIAGYWLWLVLVERRGGASSGSKRCPNPYNEDGEVEIRPLFEAEDFGAEFTLERPRQERENSRPVGGARSTSALSMPRRCCRWFERELHV